MPSQKEFYYNGPNKSMRTLLERPTAVGTRERLNDKKNESGSVLAFDRNLINNHVYFPLEVTYQVFDRCKGSNLKKKEHGAGVAPPPQQLISTIRIGGDGLLCGHSSNKEHIKYLADHLSGKECNRLVASLHFHTFELPDEIDAAERRLPDDVPCIDLLTHWNASPREGKGETHVAICHRLNQIGRQDLAKWLSRTVSHELSKDLTDSFTAGRRSDDVTLNDFSTTDEVPEAEVFVDEAAWWELDSIMEVLIGFCLLILLYGLLFWIYLCCSKDPVQCYEKVNAQGTLIEEQG